MHYLITYRDYLKNVAVTRFADRPSADAALAVPSKDPHENGFVVSASDSLSEIGSKTIIDLYNIWNESTIKKFENRAIARERFLGLLDEKFGRLPVTDAPTTEASAAVEQDGDGVAAPKLESEMAKAAKKTKKAKAPKAAKVAKVKAEKKVRVKKAATPKTPREYKAEVNSKGGDASKTEALELIKRPNGATAEQIAAKLEVSIGTAKNLIWYLRRDGKKITLNREKQSYHA